MILVFKKVVKLIFTVAAIAIALFAAQKIYQYVQHTLAPMQVEITVKYSPSAPCRKDTPLYVAIFNDSHRQVNNTVFSLSVKKDGGENLTQLLSSTYSKDQIIAPGATYEGCWSYPKLTTNQYNPGELTFSIKRKVITFQEFHLQLLDWLS